VKPDLKVVHRPRFGRSGSQVAPSAPRSIRQIRELPGWNGNPFSSETYQAPSGPTVTAVGTASARNGVPGGGPGMPSGQGTASGLKRATVVISPSSTSRRSLPAASATRKRP
jgi:hypothetical protein